jgi:hypothetical protein
VLLKSRLAHAIGGGDVGDSLLGVIACIHAGYMSRHPMPCELRDELLPMLAAVHGKALEAFSRRLSPEQIDLGMMTLAAQIILLAETDDQRAARSADALDAILWRSVVFRNLLENIDFAEALTLDVPEAKREEAIDRILGRHRNRPA